MFSLKDKLNPGQGDDDSWSFILILPSLAAKDAVAALVVDAFHVTDEFAAQLLTNTPVILLDGLSQEDALRVKEYFQQRGAEACVTQNREVKKICYRIKWRSAPSLDFLSNFQASSVSPASEDKSALERALLEKDSKLRQVEADRQLEKRIADEKVIQIMRDLEDWKSKGMALRRDVQVLTEARDHLQKALLEAQQLRGEASRSPSQPVFPAAAAAPVSRPLDGGSDTQKLREEVQELIRAKERLESQLLSARAELEASEKKNRLFAVEREKLEHAAMAAHDGRRNALEASEELKIQIQSMMDEVQSLQEARDSFEKALAQSQGQWEWTRKMALVIETDRGGLERSLLEARSLYGALLKDAQDWQQRAGSLAGETSVEKFGASLGSGSSPELLKALDEARDQYRRLENECRLVRDFFEKKFEEIRKASGSSH